MKFRCTCGHIIVDQGEATIHKARVIPEPDHDSFQERAIEEMLSFLAAKAEGNERPWLTEHFSADYAGIGLSIGEVLADLLAHHLRTVEIEAYQCAKCHRLFITDLADEQHLHSFTSDGHAIDVFKRPGA